MQDTLALLRADALPEVRWVHGDDLCDCTFQRIGEWTNPYIASTLRVRMCCIWKEIYKQYPHLVEEIPAYFDDNTERFVTEPMEWNSEDEDMPRHLWHRQVAAKTGKPLSQVRDELRFQEPPKRVPPGTGIKTAGRLRS